MRGAVAGQRLAVAAVALYLLVALVAFPPPSRWLVLVLVGVGLLALGLRSGRAALVGAALAVVAAAWTLRVAVAGDDGGPRLGHSLTGRSIMALLLGLGLLAVGELARLAADAGPRRGPVRVEEALRRRTARQVGAVGAFGLLAGAVVVLVDRMAPSAPPSVLLPLGVLAVAMVAVLVVAGTRLTGTSAAGRSAGWAPRRRARALTMLVVAGALALPVFAALGARSPLPPARASGTPAASTAAAPAAVGPDASPADPLEPPPDGAEPSDPGRVWTVLALVGVLSGLALLFLRGERMVAVDDLRPDVGPTGDPLVGAPTAPDVRALPPEQIFAALEDALGYLRADLEPRLAVRCAYAAVAGGLGRAGTGRLPSETELEFLGRQLRLLAGSAHGTAAGAGGGAGARRELGGAELGAGDLGGGELSGGELSGRPDQARERALVRLTDLFEVARFSDEPVDATMRAEALAAVEQLLAGTGRGDVGSSASSASSAPSPPGGRR